MKIAELLAALRDSKVIIEYENNYKTFQHNFTADENKIVLLLMAETIVKQQLNSRCWAKAGF